VEEVSITPINYVLTFCQDLLFSRAILTFTQLYDFLFEEVVKLLVGNKVDSERVVSREEAAEWAKARGMIFVETSAKTREGVSQVFSEVVQQVPD
jgi:GTPase SAR1 family protein